MTTLRENVETVLNHARVLKAVIAMAEEIDSAEKLEVLVNEAKHRLKATQDELDAKVESANASLKAIQKKISDAEARGKKLQEEREAEVADMIAKAEVAAEAILATAREEASSMTGAAEKARSEAEAAVRAGQAELTAINQKVDAAVAELQTTEAKIEAARAAIKQMMGG